MDSAGACARQGVKFLLMVLESTGAWDPAAARVLWEIARAAAAREGAELEPLRYGANPPSKLLTVERVMASAEFATLQTFMLVRAWPCVCGPRGTSRSLRRVCFRISSRKHCFYHIAVLHAQRLLPARRAHVPHVVEMICVQILHALSIVSGTSCCSALECLEI